MYVTKMIKNIFTGLALGLLFSISSIASAADEDALASFNVPDIIGSKEDLTVIVSATIAKTRDLYMSVTERPEGGGNGDRVAQQSRRIKESKIYGFKVKANKLKPGMYRVTTYLTPRGGNWGDRIANVMNKDIEVIDAPKYVQGPTSGISDKIIRATFPSAVTDNGDVKLGAEFDVTAPRDLHIILFDRENNKQAKKVKVSLKEPGQLELPLNNMLNDFSPGRYNWIIFLSDVDSKKAISERYRLPFTLGGK